MLGLKEGTVEEGVEIEYSEHMMYTMHTCIKMTPCSTVPCTIDIHNGKLFK